MLYYDKANVNEGIDPLKVTKVKDAWFFTIGSLIMNLNFNILYAIVVMIWQLLMLSVNRRYSYYCY